MNPKIIVTAGPLKGTTFDLSESTSVGRDSASNLLNLNDPSVSRRHCLINKKEEQFTVIDLESFNGTFVNGVPVQERLLEHGDRIALGDTLLLFVSGDLDAETIPNPVQLDKGELATRSMTRLRQDEAIYLSKDGGRGADQPDQARAARDLSVLLKISRELNSISDLETLQQRFIESVLEVIPAERGALLLVRNGLDDAISRGGWRRRQSSPQINVSRTVADLVLRERVAVLSNDVVGAGAYGNAESLVAWGTRSLLSAPLMKGESVSGLIYLDTSDPSVQFDDGHLQLLTAIAAIAAVAIEGMRSVERLTNENRRLTEELNIEHNLVGESSRMREVYRLISKLAETDSTVMIRGESGTGKELVARALHINGPRSDKPFVAINCAALTETLLESELFGYEKGAFTGAIAQRKGKLEAADGGTLFLDEVGELAPSLQAKLLRVLQEHEFERVGGTRPVRIDIRLLAATNRDLDEAISQGTFRTDLYYRLNVVSFEMPPLRERREDVPLLASFFTAKYRKKCKRRITGISPAARECLMSYDWPGNVRELENAIERAVVLGASEAIVLNDLPEHILESRRLVDPSSQGFYESVREAKKRLIVTALGQAGGNFTEAAKLLGLHPNNLHRLIRNLGLKDEVSKPRQ